MDIPVVLDANTRYNSVLRESIHIVTQELALTFTLQGKGSLAIPLPLADVGGAVKINTHMSVALSEALNASNVLKLVIMNQFAPLYHPRHVQQ